jgi:arabinose-5-phosphate isomerase
MDDILAIAKKVLQTEAEAISALVDKLNSNFTRAVEIIFQSKGRVVVTGINRHAGFFSPSGRGKPW